MERRASSPGPAEEQSAARPNVRSGVSNSAVRNRVTTNLSMGDHRPYFK